MTSNFSTGLQHMRAAIEDAQKRSEAIQAGASGSNLEYFSWKANDSKIVRFLTDNVMTENFAQFILDKDGKTRNFLIPADDPQRLNRYRSPSPGVGWQKHFKSGNLEEPKIRQLGIGVAVLRQEGPSVDGKMTIEDALVEREFDGKKYVGRQFGLVQQSIGNFWHTLAVSCFKLYGTICDRDYLIERSGDGLDTKYSIIPVGTDPELDTLQKVQDFYFYGQKWDKDDPMRYAKCPQTLEEWATYFSSEDRFKHFLLPEGQSAPAQASYSPQAQPGWAGDSSDPLSEFKNPESTAPVQQPANTNFASFRDELLHAKEEK